MGRIRSIKPGFCTSEAIAELSLPCELHFAKLWTYCDDHGRALDNPRLIKAAIWPLRDEVGHAQVEAWQQELESKGRIVRYTVEGRNYFQVVNWEEHQKPQHPKASEFPVYSESPDLNSKPHEDFSKSHEAPPESTLGEGEGVGEGEGGSAETPPRADVDELCSTLADLIVSNGARPPTVTKAWKNSARLLIDRDGIPLSDALRVMRWCQSDEFWKANILSMPKFREKFDTLRLQSQRAPLRAVAGQPPDRNDYPEEW